MAQINNTVTPGLVSPFGTPTALNSLNANLGKNTTSNYPATVTSSPTNAFAGTMQTSTPQIAGLVNPVAHPAVTAAANSHPTSLTTNPDGTVKATYDTSEPIVSTPSASNPTSNPNYNYNAGTAQTGTGAGTPITSNAGTSTPSTGTSPTTQQGLLSQIQTLINQQNSQQSGLTSQEQGLINNFTNMNAGILSQPGEIGYQTGRQAQLQQTEQSGLAALEGEQARLAGYEQPQISALTSAAGLLTPQATAAGQTVFDPSTGTFTGAIGGLSADTLNQYAQMAANGQYSAIPSSVTGNVALSAQLNQAAKAINPNYNPIASTAQGATTASNIQTGGTAATNAAAQGLQTATQNYVNANTAYTTAQNQSANLQQVLASTGINANPQFVNQKINALQSQLGSANYSSFITALTELQQKYTNLLSTVGAQTPSVNGQQATTILNPNSTPAQINAAIDALNAAAYAQLKPMYDQIGTYSSQLNGSNANSNANSTSIYKF